MPRLVQVLKILATLVMFSCPRPIAMALWKMPRAAAPMRIAVSIPAAPGFVGTYEFFGKEVLKMLGHDPVTALTFVVLLHFFQIALIAVLGIPSLFLLGKKEERP